jgi:hypothetical protein
MTPLSRLVLELPREASFELHGYLSQVSTQTGLLP